MTGRGAYLKKAKNIENVQARHDFLIAGIELPDKVGKAVPASLVSQRAFAALNLPALKITPIALNTLKSLANQLFTDPDENGETGFVYLDALRSRLGMALSKLEAARTIAAKEANAESKEAQLSSRLAATEAQSIKRQKAYLNLYSAVNGLIKSGSLQADAQERLYRVLENHHAAFADLFEPNISSTLNNEAAVTRLPNRTLSE